MVQRLNDDIISERNKYPKVKQERRLGFGLSASNHRQSQAAHIEHHTDRHPCQ